MPNNNYTAEIRKGLIRNLMFQLYSEPKTIYREYVQNALDSINSAVKSGVLQKKKDGCVQIEIDATRRVVVIKDNGVGIRSDRAVKTLLDISAHNKDGVNQAGQFGIGRLVGGGYCHKLIFRTSAKYETRATRVTFDVDKIWQMLNDAEDYLATYVINECTAYDTYEVKSDEHFFEVELNGIKDERDELLESDAIEKYLNEVAPVKYKPEFKNSIISKSLQNQPNFKELFDQIDEVQVFLGGKVIQKQYGLQIEGTEDKIDSLEFFEIKAPTSRRLAWGWFALTKFTVQIPKENNLRGIRLRKHNIQIGGSDILSDTKLWKEPRGNYYFYGEIFVTSPDIEPNTARDGLSPSVETNAFYEEITKFFAELKKLYYRANNAKKCIDKINLGIKRLKEIGQEDHKVRDLIENEGIAAFEKLKGARDFVPIARMLNLYEDDYLKAKEKAENLREDLRKKSAESNGEIKGDDSKKDLSAGGGDKGNVQTGANHVVSGEGGEKGSGSVSGVSPAGIPVQQQNEHDQDKRDEGKMNDPLVKPSTSPVSPLPVGETKSVDRLVAPLLDKGTWDENEIWIIKRALAVLYRNLPAEERDRVIVNKMMELIVEEFCK